MPKIVQTTPPNGPQGPWIDRVAYSDLGYAFRPNELLCLGAEAKERALEIILRLVNRNADSNIEIVDEVLFDDEWILRASEPFDVEFVTAEMKRLGFQVDPNYVLFSHNHVCCCGRCSGFGANPLMANPLMANPLMANPLMANPLMANPLMANPLMANPLMANPLMANPLMANPLMANPLMANPLMANPLMANPLMANYRASGERPSSAMPANPPELGADSVPAGQACAYIFDTGLANDAPGFLTTANCNPVDGGDHDGPDESLDGYLDPVSGHGTFIAGILEQIAPGQEVNLCRVLSTFGDGSSGKIAARIVSLIPKMDDRTIVNLSFGGYVDTEMPTLARAIRLAQQTGAVVVASAGNDGVCRPSYPAALPGVVSVGAIEPHGRAPYSNHGPWVRACAPGTKLTSAFFNDYNGGTPEFDTPVGELDNDHYLSWAQWTGTSFAAPVVAGALMRHIAVHGTTAKEAVAALIDAPGLFRYPGLGTVVNLSLFAAE